MLYVLEVVRGVREVELDVMEVVKDMRRVL